MKYSIDSSTLTGIANAVRTKSGTSEGILVSELSQKILDIPSGGITPSGQIEITENGTYNVEQFASALVNIASSEGYELVYEEGTIVLSSDNRYLTIEHELGVAPNVCIVSPPDDFVLEADSCSSGRIAYFNNLGFNALGIIYYGTGTNSMTTTATPSDTDVQFRSNSSSRVWKSGYEFSYVLYAFVQRG